VLRPHDRLDHGPAHVAARLARAAAALVGAGLVSAASAGAAEAPRLVLLPPATAALSPGPPLLAATRLPEQRVRGSVASSQRVLVGVAPDGSPRSVRVVQRLTLFGRGDYIFAIGVPATDVRAGPGSQSEPGFRTDAILWQGFSAGRRVLSADATLRVRDSARALPVRVRLSADRLVVENATAVRTVGFTGGATTARELDSALAALRRAGTSGRLPGDLLVHATAIRVLPMSVDVSLAVVGRLDGTRFSGVLGAGRPSRLVVPRSAGSKPRLELTVRPLYAAPALAGAPTLADAVLASLRLARLRQYDAFLSKPTPLGTSETVYEYRVAAAPPKPVHPSDDSGWSPFAIAALSLAGAGAGVGLLALWARS
jgi:hypothetical protein